MKELAGTEVFDVLGISYFGNEHTVKPMNDSEAAKVRVLLAKTVILLVVSAPHAARSLDLKISRQLSFPIIYI